MLLALDIGNTNITVGVWDGDTLRAQWRYSSGRERTCDELAALLKASFDLCGLLFSQISGVAMCSVVPPLTPIAIATSTRYFKRAPLVVDKNTDFGLVNDYLPPEAVGADRLVNAMAAREKFGASCLIVDFGTATTIDAVSHDGRYLGGAIAPGLGIASDALYKAAAKLPRVELIAPPVALARDTTSSMQSGLVFGYAGLVKELVARCSDDMKPHRGITPLGEDRVLVVLATGGLADIIAPFVPAIKHLEPNLTLEGLKILWRRATRQ